LRRVGSVQRAVKTPATMKSEMAKGERPELTSLVGASAAPSQTPAARAQATPREWTEVKAVLLFILSVSLIAAVLGLNQWSVMRSVRPRRKTASGMRKWESVRMAATFLDNVIEVL
jgi:hypothetical protein